MKNVTDWNPSVKSTLIKVLVAATAVFSAAACSTTTVTSRLHLPPRSRALQEAQSVQVVGYGGPRGPEATQLVRNAIASSKLHTLVDTALDATRAQEAAKLLASGQTTDFQKAGATVLLWGTTYPDQYESTVDETEQERCVKKDKQGNCLKQVKIKIYWLAEECSAKVTGRATRVDSGQVVVERTTDGYASSKQNAENKVPPSRRDQLCASAFRTAADRLVPFFTDYTDNVALEFQKVDDDGTTERALEFLKLSKLADAEKMLEQVVKSNGLSDEDRGKARLNLAVVYWAQAQFDRCLSQLDEATQILGASSDVKKVHTMCSEYVQ